MSTITFDRWDQGLDHRLDKRVSDANRLTVLDNCHVTTGRKIRGRPGTRKIATLEAGTKGLIAGATAIQTFYTVPGPITHANPLFNANSVPGATGMAVDNVPSGFMFNGFVYVAVTYVDGTTNHHYIDGVTVPPRITDVNCPNSRSIVKSVQKIFGPDDDTVRYCKTSSPKDWTTPNDAGFLPTGLNADGSPTAIAVVLFRSQLAVLMIDSTQLWTISANPAEMAITDNIFGIGTPFDLSPIRLAGDTFFLSVQGFRSITVAALGQNIEDVDVGTPIDDLVELTVDAGISPLAVFAQKQGQFWEIAGNYAWIYTVSRTGKINAWSRYTFPWHVDAACTFGGDLYLRTGDDVYIVDRNVHTDAGVPIVKTIELAYTDMKLPMIEKKITGGGAVLIGTAQLQFRFNPSDPSLITDAIEISEDTTVTGLELPIEISAVKVAPVITHALDEEFEFEALHLIYETS